MPTSATPQTILESLVRALALQQRPATSDSKKARGAVAVIIREDTGDLWLLMIRRRESPSDPWSGQMAFPGGHSDPQDRTLFDTVRRETLEEVGIEVNEHRFLGCLRNVQPKNAPMIVSPFVFLESKKADPTTSREATETVWVPVSFLMNPKNVSSIMVAIRGENVPMGCYRYSNHVIWGLSFRIIQEIISIMTDHAWRHRAETDV